MHKFHGRSQRIYTENVELSKRRFHSEKHQMFSVQTTPEKFEDAIITVGHFGFVFVENSVTEITWMLRRHFVFRKAPFSKSFPTTRKREAGVFKFLRSEECFRKAPFS